MANLDTPLQNILLKYHGIPARLHILFEASNFKRSYSNMEYCREVT